MMVFMAGIKTIMLIFLLLAISVGQALAGHQLLHRNIHGECLDLSEWHYQYRDQCYFLAEENPQNKNTDLIKMILDELTNAPTLADYLLDKAEYLSTAFCIEDRADDCRGYFDYKYNVIAVRKKLDLFTKVIIFIHELRHVDQVSRGFRQTLDFDANEMVRLNFAIEADANAVLALYAWRMKENGHEAVWSKLFEMPRYLDIYRAFETEMNASSDELKATRSAFIQWYQSSWRMVSYYRNSLSGYYDMLDDTKLIQKYHQLPDDYFDTLCILPDGKNYGCHLTESIKVIPTMSNTE